MTSSPADRPAGPAWRRLGVRSIRTRLVLSFGVLLALGALNVGVYHWGSSARVRAWQELRDAIERQAIITEVMDRLQDQKKYVDLMAGVIGVQDAQPPAADERARFARGVDTIAARLQDMLAYTAPERRPDVLALHARVVALAASWKSFNQYQWTEPSRAVEELYVRAEPMAAELLTAELPAAVEAEKEALARLSLDFIRTGRAFGRLAWISFILSALIGGFLALYISRDLMKSISALRVGAERIGAGDLHHRIEVHGRDEVAAVAGTFNEMADRLIERTAELATQRDDLTRTLEHLRATQAQLVQQEKMASLGQLTAGIAHEIKNPLNFVNNFAALSVELAADLEEAVEAGDAAEVRLIVQDLKLNARKIEEHGRRADGIVRSMLAHSRSARTERASVDVNALVEEYVDLAYHGMRAQVSDFSVELRREYDDAAGRVEVVPQEIGRVLLNLLKNAFDAVSGERITENGGYTPRITVRTRLREDGLRIEVEDNGPGVPEAVRERIFEPFFTTKPTGEGTGLGLSMSYDIVTQGHGGTLEVDHREGDGATFVVTLPYTDRAAGAQA